MHCYILDFIVQNFVYFNDSGKMPSDKAALCTPSFISPGTNSHYGKRRGFSYAHPPPQDKDRFDFRLAIKKKKAIEDNFLRQPFILPHLTKTLNIYYVPKSPCS